MPVPDGDARLLAEVVQAEELVVDERLERTDIERADARGRVFVQERENGEEGGLGLTLGSGCREQHVLIGIEDGVGRRHLDAAEALPIVFIDEVLHERRKAIESVHGTPFNTEHLF